MEPRLEQLAPMLGRLSVPSSFFFGATSEIPAGTDGDDDEGNGRDDARHQLYRHARGPRARPAVARRAVDDEVVDSWSRGRRRIDPNASLCTRRSLLPAAWDSGTAPDSHATAATNSTRRRRQTCSTARTAATGPTFPVKAGRECRERAQQDGSRRARRAGGPNRSAR